jgi:ATP-dependent DNA helicase RecG
MPEALKLSERIDIAVQVGESHFREFKSAYEGPPAAKQARDWKDIARDIADTLVAFANADGGELIVGVEDDGTVTGIDRPDEVVEKLLDAPRTRVHTDTPLPTPSGTRVAYRGTTVLFFSTSKGAEFIYLTSDGRCLQRKDRDTVPVATERISFSRAEVTSRQYDRAFVDGADIADLDLTLVSHVAESVSKGMSVEKCLQHLQLAEFDGTRFRLRRSALLLFASNPPRWHPRSQVRLLHIDGTEMRTGDDFNIVSDEETTDNILTLIESSWELLRPHLTETRFSKDALFRTQILYPELACREALINAIAHRDYSIEGRGIELRVFSDRLEVVSPGAILSSIAVKDLLQLRGAHESRNSLISRVLREVGYMRELGEGIRRMFDVMSQSDLAAPEIRSTGSEFSITLHHKSIYPPEVKIWVDSFDEFQLTRDEQAVVRLGYDGHVISPLEIWRAVGIVDTDYYRQLLESLRQKGILTRKVDAYTAFQVSKQRRISKKAVPQFVVLSAKEARRPIVTTETTDTSDYTKVFVANIPSDATESELVEALSELGTVADASIPQNRETGRPRGFAFVEFEHSVEADRAIHVSGQIVLRGRKLYIQKYEPPTSRPR